MKTGYRHTCPGFTLIELMVSIAIISISISWYVKAHVESQRLAATEVSMQRAVRALRNQVEILRSMPFKKLKPQTVIPFDPRVKELESLVAGRGIVKIGQDKEYPGLLVLNVKVHWRGARKDMRFVHTVLYRSR